MPRAQLEKAQSAAKSGQPLEVSVRELLSWFSAQRRGYQVVESIRQELEEVELQTVPDFQSGHIDAKVYLYLKENGLKDVDQSKYTNTDKSQFIDPAYQVGRLRSASKGLVSVRPDAPLAEVLTIMLSQGYSFLPVMASDRDVRGVIGWKNIAAHHALGNATASRARDIMDAVHFEVKVSTSFFDAIDTVMKNGYVLVKGADNKFTGIITSHDVVDQFKIFSEPFLLIGEIENSVRYCLSAIGIDRIRQALPDETSKNIEVITDLSFGDYIRVFQSHLWDEIGLKLDRVMFCNALDKVRLIRNDVIDYLRRCLSFFEMLTSVERRRRDAVGL